MKVGVNIGIDAKEASAQIDGELHPHIAKAIGVPSDAIISYTINRRSLDARFKPHVKIVYQATVELQDSARPRKCLPPFEETPRPEFHNHSGVTNPVIVGAGPAGLFAALVLSEAGAAPIVIERGKDVERRKQDIDQFFSTRQLNTESNLLFGEGGAGTWSDGKLFTRVHDPRSAFVLQEFVNAGAQPEILYYAHPHIGSDRLPSVIANLRRKICSLGGKFIWETTVADIEGMEKFKALRLSNGERIEAPAAIIACGHSARRLISTLSQRLETQMKGFQIGCRIEHPQAFINYIQFGMERPSPALGAAEYLFSTHGNERTPGATTFCMCPGGEIIPVTCKEETLATNGMSNSARNGLFANAAIISTIPPDAFESPNEAFTFLDRLERALFQEGGADYSCPAQMAGDFIRQTSGRVPSRCSYRLGIRPARLDDMLPEQIAQSIYSALLRFDKIAPGYIKYGLMVGMETRVSSPVRFVRDEQTLSSSMKNLYIAGEGGGMAGGIMSAAIDGIRLAERMLGHNTL